MTAEEIETLTKKRDHKIVKHNDIVQKSKFNFSATEQKTIAFLVSLVKPKINTTDIQPLEYNFEIMEYCKICGIDYDSGKNYKMVRDTLKSLRDKSVNVTLPDGTDTSISWINKYWSNKGNGNAKIRFDEDIAPYIFELSKNTTRYELLNILPMQSKYSIRLYEICRSWAGIRHKEYKLDELRKLLSIPDNELVRYPDFRRKVLEKAQEEINKYTDLKVSIEPVTKGRKTVAIQFHIKEKTQEERIKTYAIVYDDLEGSAGQVTML